MKLQINEIIEATEAKLLFGDKKVFSGFSTDTRNIQKGELFFAIKGERFDGNDFINDALKKGAGVVTNCRNFKTELAGTVFYAEDTLKALQSLASFVRLKSQSHLIAITGSNGKTTTKEMIASVLSEKYKVLKNEGNLNNHIGVPLSLLRLETYHEQVIIEFGMNHRGEIRQLSKLSSPNCAVITNIGKAHIGFLGSMEAIREAKLEVAEYVKQLVVNYDDDFLMKGAEGFSGKLITYGVNKPGAMVKVENLTWMETGYDFTVNWGSNTIRIKLPVHGLFNISNAVAACAIGVIRGLTPGQIQDGLNNYRGVSMRFEITEHKGVRFINDAYNANPSSMEEALKTLSTYSPSGRRIAVLGDMLELGEFSEEIHSELGKKLYMWKLDMFIAVGPMMALAAKASNGVAAKHFETAHEAGLYLKEFLHPGDLVLLKGSRAMKIEAALEVLRNAL